jgi:hypothetical protein
MFYQTIYNIDKSNRSVWCIFYYLVIENMADISTVNGKKVTNWLGKKVTGKK